MARALKEVSKVKELNVSYQFNQTIAAFTSPRAGAITLQKTKREIKTYMKRGWGERGIPS